MLSGSAMYDRFYKLAAEPFRLSPDHAFAFEHKHYSKARAYMAYAFLRAEGFVMVTGRPGTGKTTLIGSLVDQLAGEKVVTANLVCTQLQADDLLHVVAYEFGLPVGGGSKGHLLRQLAEKLKSWHREGRRALLVVDEAQDLSSSAMEELRLLTNIQVGGKPLLQIFLLGQPELRDLILSPAMEQVHQRIVAASHLQPLLPEETEAYIRHRLEVAGWKGDPEISRAVYPLLHKFSGGIPRRINLICSRLFLHCAVEQSHRVTVADVREVLEELQGEDLAAGPPPGTSDFLQEDEFAGHAGDAAASVENGPEASPDTDPHGGPSSRSTDPPRSDVDEPSVSLRQHLPPAVGGQAVRMEVRAAPAPDEAEEPVAVVSGTGRVVPLRQASTYRARSDRGVANPMAGSLAEELAQPDEAGREDRALEPAWGVPVQQTQTARDPSAREPAERIGGTEPGSDRGFLHFSLLVVAALVIVGWAATGFWPLGNG